MLGVARNDWVIGQRNLKCIDCQIIIFYQHPKTKLGVNSTFFKTRFFRSQHACRKTKKWPKPEPDKAPGSIGLRLKG